MADLCTFLEIPFHICDDTDAPDSYDLYELIVPSPGISGRHMIYKTGKILAELDFAYQFLPKWFKIISVTGTDGKSTTSWMMYQILKQEFDSSTIPQQSQKVKKTVYLSGNFDEPFSRTVLGILQKKEAYGYIVVEISSFMSYVIKKYISDYSIFTNLKSDHLNWHADLQEYADAKMNVFFHTAKKSIINTEVLDFCKKENLQVQAPQNTRFFWTETNLLDRTDGENILISNRRKYRLSETHFSGVHNAMNLLACTLVASEMRICSKRVKKYIQNIYGLPHRIEQIALKNGITYIEDSKSTSCQSLVAALGAFPPKKIVLIAGGSDKWDPFENLEMKLSETVKYVVLIGATRDILAQKCILAWVTHSFAENMKEAVSKANEKCEIGDVLLLSPGCASFGMFQDYLDRAYQFRDAVEAL